MILSKLQLDEESEMEFSMQVFGTAEQTSDIRLVIEGSEYDIILHGIYENGNVKIKVPKLKGIMASGVHECKMEVIIDGKVFSPLQESIEFEPLVEFDVQKTKSAPIKESVTVAPIKVTTKSVVVNKIDEAIKQGYEVIEYGGFNAIKKDDMYYGIVTETKMIKSKQPYSTITELVDALGK